MNRDSGAARIFRYNWPTFVATWVGAAIVVLLVLTLGDQPLSLPRWLLVLAALGALLWSLMALAVSAYVYDHSPLLSAAWVPELVGDKVRAWASVHAGLDAEVDVDAVLKAPCVARLDIFDPAEMTAASIARARAEAPTQHAAKACSADALLLDDQSVDLVVVAFTAHELRQVRMREAFFRELARVLRPGGSALLVEHPRSLPNFIAFGPGFLHFLPTAEWLRLASVAGLRIARQRHVTPFVLALVYERTP